jgi:hypothetical protein
MGEGPNTAGIRIDGARIVIARGSGVRWGWAIFLGLLTLFGVSVLGAAIATYPTYGAAPLLIGSVALLLPAIGLLRVAHRPPGRPLLVLDDQGIERVGGRRLRWDQIARVHGWRRTNNGRLSLLRIEPKPGNGRAWAFTPSSIGVSRGMLTGFIAAHGVPVSPELAADLRPDDPYELWRVDPGTASGAPRPRDLRAAFRQLINGQTSVVLVGDDGPSFNRYVTISREASEAVVEVPGRAALLATEKQVDQWMAALATVGWEGHADARGVALRRTCRLEVDDLELTIGNCIVALDIRSPWVATDAMRPRVEAGEVTFREFTGKVGRGAWSWALSFWALVVVLGLPIAIARVLSGDGPLGLAVWVVALGGWIFVDRRGWIPR